MVIATLYQILKIVFIEISSNSTEDKGNLIPNSYAGHEL